MKSLIALFSLFSSLAAAETTYWIDEVGQCQLTIVENEFRRADLSFRWTYEPGMMPGWAGYGQRSGNTILFAITPVDEAQDREPFFFAKKSDSRIEITFRSEKPDQPDPGIRGIFQQLTPDKRLQLAKKEFEAAETRLALALQVTTRDGRHDDKVIVSDWRMKWPTLRQRWLSLSYKPPGIKPEDDADFWIRLAQATAIGIGFNSQRVDPKNKGEWPGDYDDGFGGRITIRPRKEGGLRINLNCTRGLDGNELNGTDVAGNIPGSAVKKKGELLLAEAVLDITGGPEGAPPKQIRVKLQRRGGALWVETTYLHPTNRRGWLDGIYRWFPEPEPGQ